MLNHNIVLPHQTFASFAHNDNTFSENSSLFSRLSLLSKKPHWLLFTAGTILPTSQELQTFGIECHKVIKIKESTSMTEKDIIMKAIAAKNASAIVASDHFSAQEKAILTEQAQQHGCEIFFMNNVIQQTLSRHLH